MTGGFLKPLVFEPARHIFRLLTNDRYRAYTAVSSRLGRAPRFQDVQTRVWNWTLVLPDAASFLSAFHEIFVERIYDFPFTGDSPRILDLGGNIGLSVLNFKMLYPQSKITVLEADPKIFSYMERNVVGNGYDDVELINKAAWNEETVLRFRSEGADGGRLAGDSDSGIIEVPTVRVSNLLAEREFDFLKIDIEGAEDAVIEDCASHLHRLQYVFVEYHSRTDRKQSLDKIISTLAGAGFRLHIHSIHSSSSPFMQIDIHDGFDLQLNIFAWKPQ